jgi:predicted amidophosphoribosyltransferase
VLGDLVSLVLPRRCASCGTAGSLWCATCLGRLEPIRDPRCARCGAPTQWPLPGCRECSGRRLAFDRAWAAVAHRDLAALLVRRWKDGGLDLSAPAAGAVAARAPRPSGRLCPVPGDRGRVRRRGIEGPAALCLRLAGAWGVEPRLDLLQRCGSAPPQRGLTAAARRRNLATAFAADAPPERVTLVDDVYTTGATADACARALKRAGARHVEVLTFARALRR